MKPTLSYPTLPYPGLAWPSLPYPAMAVNSTVTRVLMEA